MGYCTVAAVLDQLCGVDLAPLGEAAAQTAAVEAAIADATDEVDARCRRTFMPPEAAETRLFDGGGTRLLRVPDMVRLEGLSVDGSEMAPAYVYPSDGPPFRWIATGGRFPDGYRNVAVTAWWGFGEAPPDDVVRAATALAATEVLGRLQAARSGGVRAQVTGLAREEFDEGGPYAGRIAALEQQANRLLLPYRRWIV